MSVRGHRGGCHRTSAMSHGTEAECPRSRTILSGGRSAKVRGSDIYGVERTARMTSSQIISIRGISDARSGREHGIDCAAKRRSVDGWESV